MARDFFQEAARALGNSYIGDMTSGRDKVDSFTINIRNTTGNAHKIALFPGLINRDSLLLADTNGDITINGGGKLAKASQIAKIGVSAFTPYEGVSATVGNGISGTAGQVYANTSNPTTAGIFVTSDGFSVDDFIEFLNRVPSAVKDIVVTVNDQSVLSSMVKVLTLSPFNAEGSYSFKLNDFLRESQNIDKKVTVDLTKLGRNLQLDAHTLVVYSIPAAVNGTADVQVSFQFNLWKKYDIAGINMGLVQKGE